MKLSTFHVALFSLLFCSATAQEVTKETRIDESGNKQVISSVSSPMYDGTTSEAANKYFQLGNDFATKGNPKEAIKNYQKAIEEDDQFVEAYDNLGRLYRVTNDFPNAIKCYEKSIEIYPDGPMAHQNLALVYKLQKRFPEAMKEYNELIRINPNDAEGHFGIANIHLIHENFDDALESAERALNIYIEEESPYLTDGYYLVGLIHYNNQNVEEAKKYLGVAKEKGAQIDPKLDRELFGVNETAPEKTYELKTKEDYALYEEDIIKMTDWLLQTPVSEEVDLRKQINAFVIEWVSGSPTVSVVLSEKTAPFLKCGDCLALFMASWSKYCIVNKEYDTPVDACYSATQDVISFYIKNKKELGKNKELEKMITLENKGELKSYIKNHITE